MVTVYRLRYELCFGNCEKNTTDRKEIFDSIEALEADKINYTLEVWQEHEHLAPAIAYFA